MTRKGIEENISPSYLEGLPAMHGGEEEGGMPRPGGGCEPGSGPGFPASPHEGTSEGSRLLHSALIFSSIRRASPHFVFAVSCRIYSGEAGSMFH